MESKQYDAEIAQLEAENADVVRARRELQRLMDKRNQHAYRMHQEGFSYGQLALSMGLTRSAVQGMFRTIDLPAAE